MAFTQFKSAKELADLVIEEVRKSGKCPTNPTGYPKSGDWAARDKT
jgi:hypothetical protein